MEIKQELHSQDLGTAERWLYQGDRIICPPGQENSMRKQLRLWQWEGKLFSKQYKIANSIGLRLEKCVTYTHMHIIYANIIGDEYSLILRTMKNQRGISHSYFNPYLRVI